ncbi:MAG TPA: hypothetical protein VES42_29410, partial [Pilimelia sp.]|nr:hypothetical protein [Pilimelia sp.]
MEATFETAPLNEVATLPGHAGGYDLERLGDGRTGCLAFWATAPAGRDGYLIEDEQAGSAVAGP